MRVDPHDAQQIKGEISAAKQQLSVATLECQRARVRLAELRRELVAMRRRDAQYWDEIEREFPAALSSQDSDLESPVSRQAIEEAAPSDTSTDGAALDPCEHVWISNTDNPVDGFKCMICGAPKVLLFNNDEQTARAIEAGKGGFKTIDDRLPVVYGRDVGRS